MAAFVGDKADIFDRFRQEPPDMWLVVKDAGPRHGMPLSK
jgi:hypothetical protein